MGMGRGRGMWRISSRWMIMTVMMMVRVLDEITTTGNLNTRPKQQSCWRNSE